MSNDACSSYNRIYLQQLRKCHWNPQAKTRDKIHKGKTQDKPKQKHVLEVLLRISVGYILEIGSDRGRSVWQSGD